MKKLTISLLGSALLLSSLLTACGFHLRGTEKMPSTLQHLYLQTDSNNTANPELINYLESDLRQKGVILMSSTDHSDSILLLQNFQISRQLISLSGATEAGQYQLSSSVEFLLETPEGKTLLGPITVSAQKEYSTNAMQVLAKSSIESRLKTQLAENLANQILNHLAHYSPNPS